MASAVEEIRQGQEENYLLPFFWQHGAEEPVLRELMGKIQESGIREVCVESRPHPDFCGPGWWKDMDIILEEAQRRNMRVWVLDDVNFPSGHAGGLIARKYPQHRRRVLDYVAIDALGPDEHASFLIDSLLRHPETDWLEAVVAGRRTDYGAEWEHARTDVTDLVDLTDYVKDGRVYWPVPDGLYSVIVVYSRLVDGGSALLNPISREAVACQIEGCYQPHYEHYGHLFGGVFAGFFSDEPQFACGGWSALPGKDIPLPWSDELREALRGRLGEDYRRLLPALWLGGRPGGDSASAPAPDGDPAGGANSAPGDESAAGVAGPAPGDESATGVAGPAPGDKPAVVGARPASDSSREGQIISYAYMDEASRLFSECFCQTISDWCHAHGVEYIGHVVEDNNSHSRLGPGAGHFFRAQKGQDMAGADIVMHQIHPGYAGISRHWHSAHSLTDGEFFHYGLIKLASSLAHIDPSKKGRALCENFGAYGWMEGIRLMKWLADHCLVRGINRFTPHAFTDSPFPEWDSPPHFYAQGNNPQYRFMGHLFRYMNRMCHLLDGGVHVASVLVLYQADAEWWGAGMLSQRPMRRLMQRQIDLDVVPCDAFRDGSHARDGCIRFGQERYGALVIPGAEALPGYFLERLGEIARADVPIYFVGKKPSWTTAGEAVTEPPGEKVSLEELADRILEAWLADVEVAPVCPNLRVYHYHKEEEHFFLLFNEEKRNSLDFCIKLPVNGPVFRFDVMNNRLFRQDSYQGCISLSLESGESVLLMTVCGSPSAYPKEPQPAEADESTGVDGAVRVDEPVGTDGVDGAYLSAGLDEDDGADESAGADGTVRAWETEAGEPFLDGTRQRLSLRWRISLANVRDYPKAVLYKDGAALFDINGPEELPSFSGTVRYEADFEADFGNGCEGGSRAADSVRTQIRLSEVYEIAEVWLNGEYAGYALGAPYRFDVTGLLRPGTNHLMIEVTNTLAKQVADYSSAIVPQEPGGLLADPELIYYKSL